MTWGNKGPFDPTQHTPDEERGRGPRATGLPFPGISGETKGGTRYYVGGCCLPIPLGCLTVLALGTAGAVAAKLRDRT